MRPDQTENEEIYNSISVFDSSNVNQNYNNSLMDQHHPSADREQEPRFNEIAGSSDDQISLNQIQFDHQSRDPMVQNQRAENESMISNILN